MKPTVTLIPAFDDNYLFILRDEAQNLTVAVDPGDATVIERFLSLKNWSLDAIWLTHHHHDHVGGVKALKAKYGCTVIGSTYDQHRLPVLDQLVQEGDQWNWAGFAVQVLFLPGHTLGHIAYYLPQLHWLFCGDVLFSLGCGRLFEGSPQQMYESLQKIQTLPDETWVYCAHEYTESNARFAISIDRENPHLMKYISQIQSLRAKSQPTVPCILSTEKLANPFLRPHCSNIRNQLRMQHSTPLEVFAKLRYLKNHA